MQRAQDQYDDLARVSCARFGQSRYRGAAATRYWSCPPLRCPCRVGPPVLNTRSPKSLAGTCKPSLWPCQARAPGNVFSRPETQGPKLPLSGPFSWWRLKASLNARAKSRVFGKPREISVSTRVRGGGRSPFEPVSTPNSLLTGKRTGNFTNPARWSILKACSRTTNSKAYSEIP